MQPHYPFIGDSIDHIGSQAGQELTIRNVRGEEAERDYPTVWDKLAAGELEEEITWEAYDENLELALPHVERLVDQLDGKSVIISDHGNLACEQVVPFGGPTYDHPEEIHTEELRKVPWLIVEGETRREVKSEEPGILDLTESETVSERLSDLGYVDL